MASPAARLGHPDTQQAAAFFGNFSPAPQSAGKRSAASARQVQHQQVAMDPFDLFGEGSNVPAPVAAASQETSADDGLFGDIQGHQGQAFSPRGMLLTVAKQQFDNGCCPCCCDSVWTAML